METKKRVPLANIDLEENVSGKITKKDLELLSYIAQFKVMTVRQLASLCRRSRQVVRRRIRLFEQKQIITTRERVYGKSKGRPEDLIFLTEEGAGFLQKEAILSNHECSNAHKLIDSLLLDHQLLVNWFFIHLLHIEKVNPHFSTQMLISQPQSPTKDNDDIPFLVERVSVENSSENFIEFIPDGVFSIRSKEKERALLFFLEMDMGTETIASRNRGPKDVRQKIINYQAMFKSGQYKRYETVFDSKFKGFRLLFLANTASRLTALCHLVHEMPPSDFIWLADQERMFTQGLSAEIWARGGRNDDPPQSILGPGLAFESPLV